MKRYSVAARFALAALAMLGLAGPVAAQADGVRVLWGEGAIIDYVSASSLAVSNIVRELWGEDAISDGARVVTWIDSLKPHSSSTPASYTFTDITDTGPGSLYSGLEVGQAINERGQVAFVAVLKAGGQAIYRTEANGQLTTIAQTDSLIRDFYLSPYISDRGTVSFGANLTDGAQAVFTGRGEKLTRIADTESASPFSSIPNPAPRIDARDAVYFRATLRSGATGFFAGDGGPTSALYVTGGEFSAFPSSLAHQVHGQFGSFRANLTGGPEGVFKGNGLDTETLVTAGGTYFDFFGAEINDPGTVAISATLTAGGQVLLLAKNGTLTPFVDTTGAYRQIFGRGEVSINNGGEVAFGATLKAGGRGFFVGPDPVADKIIAIGDQLSGSTVVGFPQNSMNPRALNNAGQFLFRADLADGRRVLVRADLHGE